VNLKVIEGNVLNNGILQVSILFYVVCIICESESNWLVIVMPDSSCYEVTERVCGHEVPVLGSSQHW
jgi:hypothetical protein